MAPIGALNTVRHMSLNVGAKLTKGEKSRGMRRVLPDAALHEPSSSPVDRVLAQSFWVQRPAAPPATPIEIDAFRRR